MEDKNIRQLHRQLVIAEEAEAAAAVELADPQQDARIIADTLQRMESRGELAQAVSPSLPEHRPSLPAPSSFWSSRPGKTVAYSGFSMAAVLLGVALFVQGPDTKGSREPLASFEMKIPADDRVAGHSPEPQPVVPASPPSQLSLDSVLQVDLLPEHRVSKDVQAVAFLKSAESVAPWGVTLKRSEQGTFHLRGRVRDLPGLHLGRWELIFAVGYPERMPSQTELAQRLASGGATSGEGWQILRGSLEIVETKQVR